MISVVIWKTNQVLYGLRQRITWLSLCVVGRAKSDAVFGNIRFFRSKIVTPEDENSLFNSFQYWDAFCDFPINGRNSVSVFLPSPKTGPSQLQREVFLELNTRYQAIFPRIAESCSSMLPELEHKTGIRVKNVETEVALNSLTIEHPAAYPDRLKNRDLELNYQLPKTTFSFSVSIQDWEPVATEIWDDPLTTPTTPMTLIASG